jgi:hypothetical protein
MLISLLILTTLAISLKKLKIKKPKITKPKNWGMEEGRGCSSSEEYSWRNFVQAISQNVNNVAETVEKVQKQLCSSKCGRSLLEFEDYFNPLPDRFGIIEP